MVTTANNQMETFLGDSSSLNDDASWTHYLPASMHELRAEVLEDVAGGTFIFHLGRAGAFRREGLNYMGVDPERAFVALFRAANLLLIKLPTHPDYELVLDARQRETLFSTGETTFRELNELKQRIVERQNEREAEQQARTINQHTPTQSMIRIPSFTISSVHDEGRRKSQDIKQHRAPELSRIEASAPKYPFPPSEASPPIWHRPPTPNGPRAPVTAPPSLRRNSAHNRPPPLLQLVADPPKPGTKEEESALLRQRPSSAHAQFPLSLLKSELHGNYLSPNSAHPSTKRPSYSPGPIRRIRSQGRYPLRPNSRGNVNPIEFEIKKKMKERRKACHDQTTSDSSAKFDTEGFFSSLTSD